MERFADNSSLQVLSFLIVPFQHIIEETLSRSLIHMQTISKSRII